ncbi:unnamed protein product [Psylliodes chrysocephalus]|uniref:PPPDE domain-containing protein n=1 Tax=Psylliodes chrysocephalus TaxID=3402493 RepID=A0A9P0CAU5_9CUCU|nr:unnamed protein product [Psylliodes chrysocephala]
MANPVVLYATNVYKKNSPVPVWHLGVFVFGFEYSYGPQGVTITNKPDVPLETTPMGCTKKTEKSLRTFVLEDLKTKYTALNYNALTNNCHGFAKEVLTFLGIGKEIPIKYTELCQAAKDAVGSVGGKVIETVFASKSVNSNVFPIRKNK